MHTVMESGGLRFPNRGVPKNAVRHAFATKNVVKGEVAMGVEGGSPMQGGKMSRKLCKTLGHGSHVGKFCHSLVWTSTLYSNLSCSHLGPVEKGVNPAIATECYMIWTCDRPAVFSIASQKPHAYEMFYDCVGILWTRDAVVSTHHL